MAKSLIFAICTALTLGGCAAANVAGAAVSVGATAAKTTAKAGGAVAGAAIDVVDADDPCRRKKNRKKKRCRVLADDRR